MISKIIKIIISFLFVLCLLEMPYSYFQFVRFFGMSGFCLLAFQEKNKALYSMWVISALLINPFFKIPLGRTIWIIVDVVWIIILIGTIIITRLFIRKPKTKTQNDI